MKINLLKHNEIDKLKWDEAITNSSAPKIYALSWYLDISSPNWMALADENYDYIFPIPIKQKFNTISYSPTPRFTQQLGLFSSNEITFEILKKFLSETPKNLVRKEFLLNSSNPVINGAKLRDNFILELNDYQTTKQSYSSQIKRNIKLSEKFDLDFKIDTPHQDIIHLFKTSKAKEIESIDYSILDRICQKAKTENSYKSYSVYEDEELLTGAIVLTYLNRIYLIMLSNHSKSRENGASSALIDYIIKENCGLNLILDFEGSNIPSLARFYKGFGSFNEPYQLYSKRLF